MEYSPKLIRRWAEIYVSKIDNENKESAVEWANGYGAWEGVPKEAIPRVQREIKKIRKGTPPQPSA